MSWSIGSHLQRRQVVAFIALALLVVAKGAIWAIIVPSWQGPDEPAHVAYAEDLSRGDGIRIQERRSSVGSDRHRTAVQAEFINFHGEYSGSWDRASLDHRLGLIDSIGRSEREQAGEYSSTANTYGPMYYGLLAGALRATQSASFTTSMLAMRLVTVLLAVAILFVQYRILWRIFSDWRAFVATLLLTMLPMYTFAQSVVNPDTLVTLFMSVALLLLLRIQESPASLKLHAAFGAIFALCMLTKPTIVVLTLPYVAVGILAIVRRRIGPGRAMSAGLAAAAPIVAIAGWWLVLQPASGGTASVTYAPSGPETSMESLAMYAEVARNQFHERWVMTFWGDFGWVDTVLPGWVYDVATIAASFALFGVVTLLLARKERPAWLLPNVLALVGLVGLLVFLDYGSVASGLGGFIQGRYLFPLSVAVVALLVYGLTEPYRERPTVPRLLLLTSLTCVVMLHALSLATVLDRYYA